MSAADLEWSTNELCTYHAWWGTKVLIYTHYASTVIMAVTFSVGALASDVYLVILSIFIYFDSLVNAAIKFIVRAPAPGVAEAVAAGLERGCVPNHYTWCSVPGHPEPCTSTNVISVFFEYVPDRAKHGVCVPCGVPNHETQHAAFVAMSVLLFATQWHAPRVRTWHRVALVTWIVVTGFAHVYFGFSTHAAALVAVIVGPMNAFVTQMFNYLVLVPRYADIVRWRLFRWLGLKNRFTDASSLERDL